MVHSTPASRSLPNRLNRTSPGIEARGTSLATGHQPHVAPFTTTPSALTFSQFSIQLTLNPLISWFDQTPAKASGWDAAGWGEGRDGEAAERRCRLSQTISTTHSCSVPCTSATTCSLPATRTRAAQGTATAVQPFETRPAVSWTHKEPVSRRGSGQLHGMGAASTGSQAAARQAGTGPHDSPNADGEEHRTRTHGDTAPSPVPVYISNSAAACSTAWAREGGAESEIFVSNNCMGFSAILGLENTPPCQRHLTRIRAWLNRADATDKPVQPATFSDHALEEYKNNMGSEAM